MFRLHFLNYTLTQTSLESGPWDDVKIQPAEILSSSLVARKSCRSAITGGPITNSFNIREFVEVESSSYCLDLASRSTLATLWTL
jgi:hypothetical protein